MNNPRFLAFVIPALFGALSSSASAAVYRVGPAEPNRTVTEVSSKLQPGDTVLVTGDIVDSFRLTRHGLHDAPVTVRGLTEVRNGRIVRPKLKLSSKGIIVQADWQVIEGLDISPLDLKERSSYALLQSCDNLVIRNCAFHDNKEAVQSTVDSGSILLEFCEFDSNGSMDGGFQTVDIFSCMPSARAVVRHCRFDHGTGGVFFKSHCPRTVIRYNWFENSYLNPITIVDLEGYVEETFSRSHKTDVHPVHADIIGNVIFTGQSPGAKYSLLSLGGEDVNAAGTEGDFHIAHNLFLTSRGGEVPAVPLLVHGNVDRVRVFNNAFLELGVAGCKLYERGEVWPDSPRTKAFIARRGHGDPAIEGSNNWISSRATGIPDTFKHTLRGLDPLFRDLANLDFRPRKGSPLISAALAPLPQGRVTDLTPLFEPSRSIPLDLTPIPRRQLSPPSIGPFEPTPR